MAKSEMDFTIKIDTRKLKNATKAINKAAKAFRVLSDNIILLDKAFGLLKESIPNELKEIRTDEVEE